MATSVQEVKPQEICKCGECSEYPKLIHYITKVLQPELHKKHVYSPTEWRVFMWLALKICRYPNPQPKNLSEPEIDLIKLWKKQGLSIGDMAFCLDRSKSTIHECLKFEQ